MNTANYLFPLQKYLCPAMVLLLCLLPVSVAVRSYLRRRKARNPQDNVRRCVCGYPLVGLSIPRCPECGRAIGFDRSFEEMGISEAEVRENLERRKKEREQG